MHPSALQQLGAHEDLRVVKVVYDHLDGSDNDVLESWEVGHGQHANENSPGRPGRSPCASSLATPPTLSPFDANAVALT
jgi:hypothetical protein